MAKSDDELLAKVTEQNKDNAPTISRAHFIQQFFVSRQTNFEEAMKGSGLEPARFLRIIMNQVASSKNLMEAMFGNPDQKASLIAACMELAGLGLDPSVKNEGFLIAYGGMVQAQPGYKGLMKLAINAAVRNGLPLVNFRADLIHENDIYEREFGNKVKLIHQPPPFGTDPGRVIGYVAKACDKVGRMNFREMTVQQVEDHQKRYCKSLGNPKSLWYGGIKSVNFDAYGLKTVIKQLITKDLNMDSKISRAVELDDEAEDIKVISTPEPQALLDEIQFPEGIKDADQDEAPVN